MRTAVQDTDIAGLRLLHRGKVRDVYSVDEAHLLLVATDRVSAFDRSLAPPLSGKGILLAEMARFWFDWLSDTVRTHWVEGPAHQFAHPALKELLSPPLARRSMLVKRYQRIDLECIVRGYLAGSAHRDYAQTGELNGVKLPSGLELGSRFDAPLFTPSTKAEQGQHDVPVTEQEGCVLIGSELYQRVKQLSLKIYLKAHEYLLTKNLVLVDTKFEFGIGSAGELVLIDEVFTPDSSRFWDLADWQAGRLESLDKEFLRQWLLAHGMVGDDDDNSTIQLPVEAQERTFKRYTDLYKRVMGTDFVG